MSCFLLGACRSAQRYEAVPADLDTSAVPQQTVRMTARKYAFEPELVRVPRGTLVTLVLTTLDTTHGFALDAYGIDDTVEPGRETVVTFYAAEAGELGFRCSHFCGLGHLGMNGRLVIE